MTLGSARGKAGTGQMVPRAFRASTALGACLGSGAAGRGTGSCPPRRTEPTEGWGEQGTVGNRAGGALTQERTEADLQEGKVRAMQVWGRGPG